MIQNTDNKLHVVFASAECAPFSKTGGLGDVAGSLPKALKEAGAEVIVMTPKYDTIPQYFVDKMEHVCDFYVSLAWRNEYCGLEYLEHDGVDYLFVDNERYFHRGYPYGFFDDGERFAFFAKAICESLQHLPDGWRCDVLHCNDWQTAMAPVFLREFYQGLPLYEHVKTVFSIHNILFQGQFSNTMLDDVLGLAHIPAAAQQLTCDRDSINYIQGALNYSDAITTVSPTYAGEIQTPEYGEHLDGVLRRRSNALTGILNGIDVKAWDPSTDAKIPANFTVDDRSGKLECKHALQEELGLEVRDDRPLMVMVTRLTQQKGMDLVTYSLDRILSGGVQVAVLGTGDTEYENTLRYFEDKYRGTMCACIKFDSDLSRRMYAGSDLFLMPSLFEPCGLSQMIAMRYGSLPIVRETGGLKDTVEPYNHYTGEGTGFTFTHFNGDEMGDAVFRGARLYWDDHEAFDKLVEHAMVKDFSWERSAGEYMNVYHNLHPEIPLYEPEPEPAPEPEPVAAPEPEEAPVVVPVEEPAPKAEEKPAEEPKAEAAPTPEPETPKAEEKPAEAPEADAEAKPAAKTTTARKTSTRSRSTASKSTSTRSTSSRSTTSKSTAAKSTAAKAAATDEVAAEKSDAEAKPAAKTTTRRTSTRKTTASKTAAKTEEPAAEEKPAEAPEAEADAEAKPAAKTTTARKTSTRSRSTASKSTSTRSTSSRSTTSKSTAAKSTTASAGTKTEKPAAEEKPAEAEKPETGDAAE